MTTFERLESIANECPWIIESAAKTMADKLNFLKENNQFSTYMLDSNYLRELLLDCVKQELAEVGYGVTV